MEKPLTTANLKENGYCILTGAVSQTMVTRLLAICSNVFTEDSETVRARSSRGHVYAARNLIQSIPEVSHFWRTPSLLSFLSQQLGNEFGLVRALFFDKPPERTWTLPWHKDTSIAVQDNTVASTAFSRPTTKAGIPHLIACDEVLHRMLTLRIHLDTVTDENGPLRVVPGSHTSSKGEGEGIESAVTIHANPGDILAMRPLITHSSNSSQPGTLRHRRILHLEFAASPTLPGGVEWHDFVPASTIPKPPIARDV